MRWCVRTAQLAPGSAGIALECERASLTPQTPFRARCLVDHAGARSGVSIPTRTSIRWGEGPGRAWAAGAGGRRTGAFEARAAGEDRRPCCGREREGAAVSGWACGDRGRRWRARGWEGAQTSKEDWTLIEGGLGPHLGGHCEWNASSSRGPWRTGVAARRRRTESTMARPARRAPSRGRRACAREGGPWGGWCAPRRERAAQGRREVATGGTLGECSVSAVRSDRDNWMFGGSRHRASAVAGQ